MRKAKPKKRILLPDPKFGDVAVTRFVNNLMLDGKKSICLLYTSDVPFGRYGGVLPRLNGVLFGRQAESVVAHRMKYVCLLYTSFSHPAGPWESTGV